MNLAHGGVPNAPVFRYEAKNVLSDHMPCTRMSPNDECTMIQNGVLQARKGVVLSW